MCRIFVLSFAGWIFTVFTLTGQDLTKKVDSSLRRKFEKNTTAEYIILMKDRAVFKSPLPFNTKNEKAAFVYRTLVQKAESTQKSLVSYLKSKNIDYQSFYVTNAIKTTTSYDVMLSIASLQEVEKIIDNGPIKMLNFDQDHTLPSIRNAEPEWGLKMIKADSVWQLGIRGGGAVIAGQDTGYDWGVSPLKPKYKGYVNNNLTDHNYNWHDAIIKNNPVFADSLRNPCGYNLREPCDDNNHGTHTMGTMVGEDDSNSIGVAPDARWIACRNMDRGWGQPSTYMECFEWFLAPYDLDHNNADPTKSPHVINNSWYCSEEEGCNASNFILMEEIVKNLKASGVVVVVSAGNSGGAGCGSVTGPPAFFESSFSVGATNREDNIAGFSSRGPVVIDSSFRLKPNVSAPGVGVRSVISGGSFASFNGTSMAGPHVAGLVGLIISANPSLAGKVEVIEDIIEATAVPRFSNQDCGDFKGSEVPNAVFGHGRVDAYAAVKKALAYTSNTSDDVKPQVSIFPNPTDDWLTFTSNDGTEYLKVIEIFNSAGQLISKQVSDSNLFIKTIPVHTLPQGVYFYSITIGISKVKGRFVKM
jgi:subtilisin family serine protease